VGIPINAEHSFLLSTVLLNLGNSSYLIQQYIIQSDKILKVVVKSLPNTENSLSNERTSQRFVTIDLTGEMGNYEKTMMSD
jgi:hypothetical protein